MPKSQTKTADNDKPELRLSSAQDGNAFLVIGAARKVAKQAGWSTERWEAVKTAAMAGNYDNMLQVLMEHFDVV